MSKLASDGQLARRAEKVSLLRAATVRKQVRNNEAAEREHFRLSRKVAHEFDNAFGSGGILKRGIARVNSHGFGVPAERKRSLISSTSGRSFHGHGTTHRKESAAPVTKGRKRSGSTGAAHYRYIEDPRRGEIAASLLWSSHAAYIDGSRVETSDDGERQSDTNIEGSFADRVHFFALANEFERQSHGDKISFDPNRTSDEMAAVLAAPLCDPALKEAFEQRPLPYSGKPIVVQLEGNNRDLRALMKAHGIKLSAAGKNEDRRAQDGIAFHTGRSGRTHFRWVFELPMEFTARQRQEVLNDLGAHMKSLGCMYATVIHAPDPHNDEKNYHIHLIFYDRLCRRLKGTEDDLQNVNEDLKASIRDEIDEGKIKIKPGQWDFTVARTYKCVRSYKTHFPFRAEKSRGVTTGKDFMKRFRREYAAIVNDVSKRAGGPTIYDPRSYTDRQVDITPSKKLGPRLHTSETVGIPTIIGVRNERNQADDERRSFMKRYQADENRLGGLARELAPYVEGAHHPRVAGWARQPARDVADARFAAEARLALDMWLLETARERSRALFVRDRQRRAAAKGPVRERRDREVLAAAAQAHLDELELRDVQMLPIISDLQRDLEQTRTVTDESVAMTIANCKYIRRLFPAIEARTQTGNLTGRLMGKSLEEPLPETVTAPGQDLVRNGATPSEIREGQSGGDATLAAHVQVTASSTSPADQVRKPSMPTENPDEIGSIKMGPVDEPVSEHSLAPANGRGNDSLHGRNEISDRADVPAQPVENAALVLRAADASEHKSKPLFVPSPPPVATPVAANHFLEKDEPSGSRSSSAVDPRRDRRMTPPEDEAAPSRVIINEGVDGLRPQSAPSYDLPLPDTPPANTLLGTGSQQDEKFALGSDLDSDRVREPVLHADRAGPAHGSGNCSGSGDDDCEAVVDQTLLDGQSLAVAFPSSDGDVPTMAESESEEDLNDAGKIYGDVSRSRLPTTVARPKQTFGMEVRHVTTDSVGDGEPDDDPSHGRLDATHATGPVKGANLAAKAAVVEVSGQSVRKDHFKAWDALGLNENDVLAEIERDQRVLILRNGHVSFAKPDEASRAHRLCLATFQLRANRYFKEQQARINDEQIKADLVKRGAGIA